MSEATKPAQHDDAIGALTTMPPVIDWRQLAARRLARLVELEHDCAVMRERLDVLRTRHDVLLRLSDEHLQKLHELRTIGQTLDDLTRQQVLMENSRSWRITAPMRAFFRQGARGRRFILRMTRTMLQSSRLGPFVARLTPALHARVRSKLSSHFEMH